MDPLGDLLNGVRARTTAFCRAILEPPWALRIADGAALALATAQRGHAWIVPDRGEPVLMRTGDVAVIKGPAPYTVGDDPCTVPDVVVGADNRVITMDGVDVTDDLRLGSRTSGRSRDDSAIVASGTYQVGNDVTERLLNALPDIVLVPKADPQSPVMTLLAHELGRDGPGQQIVLDRLLDIALVATIRAWFDHLETAAPGWYRAYSDALVGPALRLIHDDPGHPWTVASLASRVGCSRAAFARRFTTLVGEPPVRYLTGWRIALAADLLRTSDLTVESVAHQVGYANAFALSVAFKRVRGVSPTRYRDERTAGLDSVGLGSR
ncbi:AraC family transcriptional regulator [Frankia sp. CNm7]|uniref:AraC family transcriptional regulator n=1 Tax=Frankia nepalensis TaxID=1836974 RepID=A0A937UQY6_9ACTN|nr:AraC family transcriptional regulator [Frankia nepalensis]MBL7508947.1 AraC family transcriptional regulator [Frankia nepalensis]MBL7516787.1 AraC family transcriptional regulator [Frankia nepalensis]MBL7628725.1 AraC family transcriptional regulator [Frankia nepalensis]